MILVKFAESVLSPLVAAINELTQTFKKQGENIVSALDDVKSAINGLGSSLSTALDSTNESLQQEFAAVVTAIQNAASGGDGISAEDAAGLVTSLQDLGTSMGTRFATLKQAIDDETAKLTAPPAA